MDGLHDEPRSGAPRSIEDAGIKAVIVLELARHGQGVRNLGLLRATHLAGVWPAAA